MSRIIWSASITGNDSLGPLGSVYYYTCQGNVSVVGEPCTSCRGICTEYELMCPLCGSMLVRQCHRATTNVLYEYACGTVVRACANTHTGRRVPYAVCFTPGHELSETDDVI